MLLVTVGCQPPSASVQSLPPGPEAEAQRAAAPSAPQAPTPMPPRTDHPEHHDLLEVERGFIVLPGRIEFEEGEPVLLASTLPHLDQVADFLLARTDLGRIEIQAHLDADFGPRYGRKPSQHRADAVRDYLVERGVDPDRLEARGYGEERPIDTNTTPEGRANNRRIELRLLDPEVDTP